MNIRIWMDNAEYSETVARKLRHLMYSNSCGVSRMFWMTSWNHNLDGCWDGKVWKILKKIVFFNLLSGAPNFVPPSSVWRNSLLFSLQNGFTVHTSNELTIFLQRVFSPCALWYFFSYFLWFLRYAETFQSNLMSLVFITDNQRFSWCAR